MALELTEELNQLYLTTTLDVSALHGVKRLLPRLLETGIDRKNLGLIVNQVPKNPEILPVEVSQVVGLPICAVLPEARGELFEAYSSGSLLGDRSRLRREIARLSIEIAGQVERKSK